MTIFPISASEVEVFVVTDNEDAIQCFREFLRLLIVIMVVVIGSRYTLVASCRRGGRGQQTTNSVSLPAPAAKMSVDFSDDDEDGLSTSAGSTDALSDVFASDDDADQAHRESIPREVMLHYWKAFPCGLTAQSGVLRAMYIKDERCSWEELNRVKAVNTWITRAPPGLTCDDAMMGSLEEDAHPQPRCESMACARPWRQKLTSGDIGFSGLQSVRQL